MERMDEREIGEKESKGGRLLRKLRGELRDGRMRPGTFLGTGESEALRHGVSAPTWRLVVRSLVDEGWLEPLTRGVRVPVRHRPSARIALVRSCDTAGRVPFEAERMARFRRHLELEILRQGCALEVWGYSGEGRLHPPGGEAAEWDRLVRNSHGVVLSLWDVKDDEWILAKAARPGHPVAVWDERPGGGLRPHRSGLQYVDSSQDSGPGGALARHLLSTSGTTIAWVSPFQGSVWSKGRLDGIRHAAGDALVCEAVDTKVTAHSELEGEDPRRWLDVEGLAHHTGRWLQRSLDDVVRQTEVLLQRRHLVERLEPLFQKALESRARAWICANDDVALLAWDWLAARGIEVPRRVMLAGFDDLLCAQERSLTSVYFQEDAVANACVHHLLRPRHLQEEAGAIERIDGIVVPRNSTSAA